jgi:hypothetical protein
MRGWDEPRCTVFIPTFVWTLVYAVMNFVFHKRRKITFSISMSGVHAQGDPCTATIFRSVLRLHMLYSVSSPVRDKVQYLTQRNSS